MCSIIAFGTFPNSIKYPVKGKQDDHWSVGFICCFRTKTMSNVNTILQVYLQAVCNFPWDTNYFFSHIFVIIFFKPMWFKRPSPTVPLALCPRCFKKPVLSFSSSISDCVSLILFPWRSMYFLFQWLKHFAKFHLVFWIIPIAMLLYQQYSFQYSLLFIRKQTIAVHWE